MKNIKNKKVYASRVPRLAYSAKVTNFVLDDTGTIQHVTDQFSIPHHFF